MRKINFFKKLSLFLTATIIANLFAFIMLSNPIPVSATADAIVAGQKSDAQRAIIAAGQKAKETAWQAIKTAWQEADGILTKAYRATDIAIKTWGQSESILAKVSYTLMYITTQVMLEKMTKDIIAWISGEKEGAPKIIENFEKEFSNALDIASGEVVGGLLGLNNNELCDPNFLKVDLAIALDPVQQPTFKEKLRCSLSGGIENLKKFKEDFSNGGWANFVRISSSQNNNRIGLTLTAQREQLKKIAEKEKELTSRLASGAGFGAQEVCIVTKDAIIYDSGAFTGEESETFTQEMGQRMDKIMKKYGYSDLKLFKAYWKSNGGDFDCKIETPASTLSKLGSDVLIAPFKKITEASNQALAQIGSGAPAILKPYLDAISAAALNRLIKEGRGLVSSELAYQRSRKYRAPNSKTLERTTRSAFPSKNLLENSQNIKKDTLKTIINFNGFIGSLKEISDSKSYLWGKPITKSDIINSLGISAISISSLNNDIYSENNYKNLPIGSYFYAAHQDRNYRDTLLRFNEMKNSPGLFQPPYLRTPGDKSTLIKSHGAPTIPLAGTISLAAEQCGAFSQISNTTSDSAEKIKSDGYVALKKTSLNYPYLTEEFDAGEIIKNPVPKGYDGWTDVEGIQVSPINAPSVKVNVNGKARILVFYDGGTTPKRFIREVQVPEVTLNNGGSLAGTGNTITQTTTFISGSVYKIIEATTTPDTIPSESRPSDINLYTYELLDITKVPNADETFPAQEEDNERVFLSTPNTSEKNNSGKIYFFKDLRIDAYAQKENFTEQYYSPEIEGASASVRNFNTVIEYKDTNPLSDASVAIENSMSESDRKIKIRNKSPYLVSLGDFYPEISKLSDKYMYILRALVGYDRGNLNKKTNFSSISDQIGVIPDNDLTYTSVSDVLSRYNNLTSLYQTLFTGVNNPDALASIDPKFEVLNPIESNIKIALAGQKCPPTPPSEKASDELKERCGVLYSETDILGTPIDPEYNMGGRFMFVKDPISGFATNPFTQGDEAASTVMAGILNIDEMTAQLNSLPPNSNIIKLIRIRQILEQLQVTPKPIISFGATKEEDVVLSNIPKLKNVDIIEVKLRNYPEIESFLNQRGTTIAQSGEEIPLFRNYKTGETNEYVTIEDLISLYGFDDLSKQEAYTKISADLDNILPDIITQIQDQLKNVFLKRVERELAEAETKAKKRLTDFIYFARDLNPSIQLQIPTKMFAPVFQTQGIASKEKMDISGINNTTIRIISKYAEQDPLGFTANRNCMSLTGEKLECDSAEYDLRGFDVYLWESSASSPEITIKDIINPANNSDRIKKYKIAIRKAIMSAIVQKLTMYNEILGVDINSVAFEDLINRYSLEVIANDNHTTANGGHDGTQRHVNITDWDDKISKGLDDVYRYFFAVYMKEKGLANPTPGQDFASLSINNDIILTSDIKTRMFQIEGDFNLLEKEFTDINDWITKAETKIRSIKSELSDIRTNLREMKDSYSNLIKCSATPQSLQDTVKIYQAGTNYITETPSTMWTLPISAIDPEDLLRVGLNANPSFSPNKDRCIEEATKYNVASVQLANRFICGL